MRVTWETSYRALEIRGWREADGLVRLKIWDAGTGAAPKPEPANDALDASVITMVPAKWLELVAEIGVQP